MERWIMHVDMDAFYASVEQYRIHPELIGLPVCVGPDPKVGSGRGVVRAASYEARAQSVRSGMPVTQAMRLCPNAVFVGGSFRNYLEASDEVMEVLKQFADDGRVRRASIDEAYIEVTIKMKEYTTPVELAKEIQTAIRDKTKLPCSIGIAPNMAVAKIATGRKKPLGITYVPQDPNAVAEFLSPLEVSVINGVGRMTTRHLNHYGIRTLRQIQEMSIADLYPIMGKSSQWLYDRAWGIDNRPIRPSGPRRRKSISKDRTFMDDVAPTSIEFIQETLADICTRIWRRLTDKEFLFRTVTVKIRFGDYTTIQRSKTLTESTDDELTLWKVVNEIYKKNIRSNRLLRLLGVKVSNLTSWKEQASLTDFI